MSIRVLLADDHGVVRKGLRFLLERQPDIEIVGEAADGREAVRLALNTVHLSSLTRAPKSMRRVRPL